MGVAQDRLNRSDEDFRNQNENDYFPLHLFPAVKMRQKRAKAYRKLMALYSMTFGFRQPYQVLIDASFCEHASNSKIELEKQLDAVFQGQAKPSTFKGYLSKMSQAHERLMNSLVITQCCMVELYKLGPAHQVTVDMAKRFERRKCNHREAIESDQCVLDVVGS